MRLEHINLTVNNLEQSADLYCKLYDGEVAWRGQTDGGIDAVHIKSGDFYLALFQSDVPREKENDYSEAGFNHFGVIVDDVDKQYEKVKALGLQPTEFLTYEPGRRFYVFDHDGHELEFISYN